VRLSTRRGRPTKAETEKRKRAEFILKEKKRKRQIISIILFALSVFVISLSLIPGQNVWHVMHNVLFGIFGVFSYIVGPFLMAVAVYTAYDKTPGKGKTVAIVLLMLSVSGAFLIFSSIDVKTGSIADKIERLYLMGIEKKGGGVASAPVGLLLSELFGYPGANITVLLIIFVLFMIVTGKTIIDLVEGMKKPIVAQREKRIDEQKLIEEFGPEKDKIQSSVKTKNIDIALTDRSDIDIPLGPPPPETVEPLDLPFEPNTVPEEIETDLVLPPSPPEIAVLTIFEEAERERREMGRVFAEFPGRAENGTEELIRKAAEKDRDEKEAVSAGKHTEKAKDGFKFPSIELLEKDQRRYEGDISAELRTNADFLVKTLESFGVKTRVVDISRGPTVTRYELQPDRGVRLSKITNLADDIALNLATAGVRIEAPIPNKAAVGIEVPNNQKRMVRLRPLIESREFAESESPLTFALGRDISGKVMVADIAKMPHLLIAGTTGSGKSRTLHSMIISLIYKSAPEDLRFVFIDPKMVEFGIYNGIPHMLIPVVTDARKASGALGWAVGEMLKRYKLFSETGVRDINAYNKLVEKGDENENFEEALLEKLPRIVIIIDELADLMMASPREVEDSICRLAQMARAAGLHLVIATQRPSVDVITGVIKANISSRIALSVSSQVDSRTIIDSVGAEKLIGNGDMLFMPMDLPKPVRIQGAFVSDEEIDRVVKDLKKNFESEYNEEVLEEIERQAKEQGSKQGVSATSVSDDDEMLDSAIELVIEIKQASTSMLQRRLKLGYARAARIMDEMEAMGIVGPQDGAKPRTVNMTKEQWYEMKLARGEE
jgi:S-DNA-T family DNA segregation ATPase FtsK/SpoIIIE